MRVTFLGTGTSHGIPVIACSCPVCQSSDPKDKRFRSSILVESDGKSIVIDTGYEFRLSAVRAGIKKLDAVLYTHSHSDHIMGLDDLRVFTHDSSLPIYGSKATLDHIKNVFSYAFSRHDWPCNHADKEEEEAVMELRKHNYGLPLLIANEVDPYGRFSIASLEVEAIPVMHGLMEVYAYRINQDFAYVTDVSSISERSLSELHGVKTLVIGALRERQHPTHFTFREAEGIARKLGVERCYFTHISHETFYSQINRSYGPLCLSAYDGLTLEV